MRIAKIMLLVVAIALVPLSVGLVMLKQQQNTRDALNRALTSQVSEQSYRFRGVEDQAGATLKVLSQNSVLEDPLTKSSLSKTERAKINGSLLFLGKSIYHDLISAAGVIDNAGHCPSSGDCRFEVARAAFFSKGSGSVGAGSLGYSEDQLNALRLLTIAPADKIWIDATKKLKLGEVYTSGISKSADTNRWTVTFATPLLTVNGKQRGTLYFELDIENFRRAAASAVRQANLHGLELVIVDKNGRVVLNSALRQNANQLVGANDKRFISISKKTAASGITTISTNKGPQRVAWQRLPVTKLNKNGWTVISAAPAPSGNIISNNPIPVALMGLALLAIAFVMGRRWVRTSTQALTDPLTGLHNRRKLVADLQKALPDAGESAPLLLGMFDLDGFKNYNDSFGHPAGDALLTRLGHNLQTAMRGHDGQAYRMGGDEFCIIATLGADGQGQIIADATAALSERGEGFAIGSSYGSVLLPQEASDAPIALRLTDQRLYANKNSGRRSAGRQSADVLLQALHERSPELGDHLVDVSRLAAEVGRRLGMSGEELDQLAQAAQLHDVGKMAIPDAILKKPGPLDREEWEFIRGHTVVGERIISAAPSLSQVSRIVRSSHERYNGSGYPDGLKGDEIPLTSRIIAVCDAFDAMIGPRPYRLGMNNDNAASELRRCAGAQFDPVVIEFFLSVVGELAKEAATKEAAETEAAETEAAETEELSPNPTT
ncbi:MAG TPA: HD domain-containing phosphohydrolase [Gaiellaceae bacterium]